MKKSFLSRTLAAAFTVPFALSQTVLFASFAADDTAVAIPADTTFISTDTFVNIPYKNTVSPIVEVEKYHVYEQESIWNQKVRAALNAVADDSKEYDLNADALIDQISRIQGKWYTEILEQATAVTAKVTLNSVIITADFDFPENKRNEVKNEVVDKILSADSHIEEEVARQYITVNTLETAKAQAVLTIDTTKVASDKQFSFKVDVTTDKGEVTTVEEAYDYATGTLQDFRNELLAGSRKILAYYQTELKEIAPKFEAAEKDLAEAKEKLDAKDAELTAAEKEFNEKEQALEDARAEGGDVAAARSEYYQARRDLSDARAQLTDAQTQYNEAKAEYDEKKAEYDEAQKKIDSAEYLIETAVDKQVNRYQTKIDKVKALADAALEKEASVTYEKANYNEVLQAAKADAQAKIQNNKAQYALTKVPDTISEALDNATVVKLYSAVVAQLNEILNPKGFAGEFELDKDAEILESIYDVTVSASLSNAYAEGATEGYLVDDIDEAGIAYYYDYFNELLAPEGLEVDTLETVKKLEADGSADYNSLSGEGTFTFKRIITITTKEKEETTTTETETTASETTNTNTETSVTETTDTNTETSVTETTDTNTETSVTETTDTNTETSVTETTDTNTETSVTETTDTNTETSVTETTDTNYTETTDTNTETSVTETTDTNYTETTDTNTETSVTETTDTNYTETTDTNTETTDTNTETSVTETTDTNYTETTDTNTETADTNTETSVTETTETTETTESGREVVAPVALDVDGDFDGNKNFYFSHDPRPFTESVTELVGASAYYVDGTTGEKIDGSDFDVDYSLISFSLGDEPTEGLSPVDLYENINAAKLYEKPVAVNVFYDGKLTAAQLYVYIGVKGDANLDGRTNSVDAATVLVYAADKGAGKEAHIRKDASPAVEAFAWFLADTNTESKDLGVTSNNENEKIVCTLNSVDAGNILVYAAASGSGAPHDWGKDILKVNLPKYTKAITEWIEAHSSTNQ